jgi:vacuole morphology and inheritance protein 14
MSTDVKNGANLLDQLIKMCHGGQLSSSVPATEIIFTHESIIRQLIVGWITLLDSIPDISMLDYLSDFLDGLFNMLSDSNREIRQAADSALSDFLRELSVSAVVEFGPIISILVIQCRSKERLNRLTAITWLAELIHHPFSGGDALLPFHSGNMGADSVVYLGRRKKRYELWRSAPTTIFVLVRDTSGHFELRPLLATPVNCSIRKMFPPRWRLCGGSIC